MTKLLKLALHRPLHLFYGLLALDGLIVLLHLMFGPSSNFFHLDMERNLPTYYQSFKLFAIGLLLFWGNLKLKLSTEMKVFTLTLALALTALGLDEMLEIHENIYRVYQYIPGLSPEQVVTASLDMGYRSSLWLIYYIPVFFIFTLWCGYWLRYFQTSFKSNFWLIIISATSLFGVLVAEIIGSSGLLSPGAYFWIVTFEEAAELTFATSFALVGIKALRKHPHHHPAQS
jgi:hypothetical protein